MSSDSQNDRELIRVSRDADVVTLHFNDPARLNAMGREMGEAFRELLGFDEM